MDPQRAWDDMLAAIGRGERDEARQYAADLADWLSKGGFPPKTTDRSGADTQLQKAIVLAVCRLVTLAGEP